MPRTKILKSKVKEPTFNRRERILKRLGGLLGVELTKTTPTTPEFIFEPEPRVRYPLFDYVNLFEVATTSWPLRRAFRAIIQECTRNRWEIKPAFKWKCTKCNKTFDHTPGEVKPEEKPKCPDCQGELRPPDEAQARLFERLLSKPNRDYHFLDFVKSSIFYDLALDDWYWGIGFRRVPKVENGKIVLQDKQVVWKKRPVEIYVEDARFIFPVADEFGHLGGYEWFCPVCYDKQPGDQPVVAIRPDMTPEDIKAAKICPLCKGPMEQTAYVQEIQGQVLARFAKDELIHGSSSRVAPALFGNSKIITVWKISQTVLAMDDYNWEVYSTGKVGSILGFPNEDQLEVDEKKKAIEEELKKLDSKDIQSGRFKSSKKIRTLMLGLKKDTVPVRIPIMENLKDMQSIEFYKLYMEAIAGVYGVTPEFVSTSDASGGGIRLKIDVQNRTTQEHQTGFADLFNEELLSRFNITDWIFVFKPIEGRDQLRDAQTEHTRASAAFTWSRAGFDVILGPSGELVVTGQSQKAPEPEQPKTMVGKPEYYLEGEPSRTGGERLELFGKAEAIRLPISWYSMSQIRIFDRVYALTNDKDEVFVVANNKEVDGTRVSTENLSYAVANLLEEAIGYVEEKLAKKKIVSRELKDLKKLILRTFRRGFEPGVLIFLSNYLDDIGQGFLAEKFDYLRVRLEKIKPSTFVTPKPTTSEVSGEMLETVENPLPETDEDLMRKGFSQARAPFSVMHQREKSFDLLKDVLKWAKDELGKGSKREVIINESLIKAKDILDKSYDVLVKTGVEHASRRAKRPVILSPEELRRINSYKEETMADFERILRDSLREKKNDGKGVE